MMKKDNPLSGFITHSYEKAFESAINEAGKLTQGTPPNGLAFAEKGDIIISDFGTDNSFDNMNPISVSLEP